MKKLKLLKSTQLDRPAKLWIAKCARRHFHRMPSYYELCDLIQDGYWLWYQLLNRPRYRNLTDKPQVMNLFKMAYMSWIHDLSKERQHATRKTGEAWGIHHFAQQYNMAAEDLANIPDESNECDYREFVATMPKPIHDAINSELSGEPVYNGDGTRETTTEKESRLLSIKTFLKGSLVCT